MQEIDGVLDQLDINFEKENDNLFENDNNDLISFFEKKTKHSHHKHSKKEHEKQIRFKENSTNSTKNDSYSSENLNLSKKLDNFDPSMKIYYSSEKISLEFFYKMGNSSPENYNFSISLKNEYIPNNLEILTNCSFNKSNVSEKLAIFPKRQIKTQPIFEIINDIIKEKWDNDIINQFIIGKVCHIIELLNDSNKNSPSLINNQSYGEAWWKLDRTFFIPKSVGKVLLANPVVKGNPKNYVLGNILMQMVGENLQELLNQASSVGYSLGMSFDDKAYEFYAEGFSENIPKLLEKMLFYFKNHELTSSQFIKAKQKTVEKYNRTKQNAYEQSWELLNSALIKDFYSNKVLFNVTKNVTFEELLELKAKLFENFYIKSFCIGNINKTDCERIFTNAASLFTPSPSPPPSFPSILNLPNISTTVLRALNDNPKDLNHAIENYYQTFYNPKKSEINTIKSENNSTLLNRNLKESLMLKMLIASMKKQAFSYLRTTNQLGYNVWAKTLIDGMVNGFSIGIQGSAKNPLEMDEKIEEFVERFYEFLVNKTNVEFKMAAKGSLIGLLNRDNSLGNKAERYWKEIVNGKYEFDKFSLYADTIKSLQKEDFINFYQDSFIKDQKKLSVQVWSRMNKTENNSEIPKETRIEKKGKIQKIFFNISEFENMERY